MTALLRSVGPLPDTLPDGRPWPRVSVIVLSATGTLDAATRASLAAQAPIPVEAIILAGDGAPRGVVIAEALRRAEGDYVIVLDDGDSLAPRALAMALITLFVEKADLVAGLRVLSDGSVDVVPLPPGPLSLDHPLLAPDSRDEALSTGADLLVRRDLADRNTLARVANAANPVTTLLRAAAERGDRLALMGQVMVTCPGAAPSGNASAALRVLALNDSGLSGGGAAIAHRRLVDALRLAGSAVDVVALFDASTKAAAERTRTFPEIERRVAERTYDLALIGNIHGATRSVDVLRRLNRTIPVAAVTHDLFMLTGRCAMPLGCDKLKNGCDATCPTADAYPELSRSAIATAWQEKRDFLADRRAPLLLANSAWMASVSREVLGEALADRVARIDLAFPTQVFAPGDRAALRRGLGLPQDDVLIMFAAVVADDPIKGLGDILDVLRDIARRGGVGFVAIGRIDAPGRLGLPNLFAPGPIINEQDLAQWYGACDLFVTASRSETLGQMPIEAGLCGTPTVAFRRTGLTTAVIDGVSGLLADPATPGSFASAIAALIEDPTRRASLGAWGSLALAARNSPAAAVLSLLHPVASREMTKIDLSRRITFAATLRDVLVDAATPAAGATGMVEPEPGSLKRLARSGKRRLFGRTTPYWLRRGIDVLQRVGHAARRGRRHSDQEAIP